ncbi:MAG: HAD family hydrolase [Deltaproteobacteria bacterium]|nr:MAG: HAD family hydrolase [Deltaproteobacteria bacterium]
MRHIKAIGFDLFNTLITMKPAALQDALRRLTSTLKENGVAVEHGPFVKAHGEAVLAFLEKTKQDGKESHNRFWISSALTKLGHSVAPDEPHISMAVETYFSAFIQYARVIPGTKEMLSTLRGRYRLGLLSNFTHPPAAKNIISQLGLAPFFEVVLISGDLGYRKPHPLVFQELIKQLGVREDQILYVGDDPEADVAGAMQAGLQPVWTTYVRDNHISPAPGMLGPTEVDPGPEVVRISNWKDLLSLLDGNRYTEDL